MATNQRTYEVQACDAQAAAVVIAGLTSVQVRMGFESSIHAPIDGLLGGGNVDRSGQSLGGTLQTQDVTKLSALLSAAFGAEGLQFYTRESGLGTYESHIICPTLAEAILHFHSGSVNVRAGSFATMSAQFEASFLDSTKVISDIYQQVTGVLKGTMDTAVPYVAASRLMGPETISYDQGPIAPNHVLGFTLNVAGEVVKSFDDSWKGAIVDVNGYAISGSITYGDAKATTGDDLTQQLIDAAIGGTLTITVRDAGGTGVTTYNLKNLTFGDAASVTFNVGTGHHEWTLPFKMFWDSTLDTLAELIVIT